MKIFAKDSHKHRMFHFCKFSAKLQCKHWGDAFNRYSCCICWKQTKVQCFVLFCGTKLNKCYFVYQGFGQVHLDKIHISDLLLGLNQFFVSPTRCLQNLHSIQNWLKLMVVALLISIRDTHCTFHKYFVKKWILFWHRIVLMMGDFCTKWVKKLNEWECMVLLVLSSQCWVFINLARRRRQWSVTFFGQLWNLLYILLQSEETSNRFGLL